MTMWFSNYSHELFSIRMQSLGLNPRSPASQSLVWGGRGLEIGCPDIPFESGWKTMVLSCLKW